jgi:hypothetical protein
MERLRRIAFVILFAGWMVPALLAQKARERAPVAAASSTRTRLPSMTGVEPPAMPADRVVTMFRTVAGLWFFVALVYASVLTMRFRRTILS